MVLTRTTKTKILNAVKKEPLTVQDIAHLIGKSWVTADNYVKKLSEETGLLNIKVFRQNSKASLKIVYWNYIEKAAHNEIRQQLYEQIKQGQKKGDFDPLDIYQYVNSRFKRKVIERYKTKYDAPERDLPGYLKTAEREVFCFSGNLSWINRTDFGVSVFDTVKQLAIEGVQFRILCRVDLASLKNIDRINQINDELGQSLVEIKHCKQPLRGFLVDEKKASFMEEKHVKDYKPGELEYNQKTYYEITEESWILWLKQVFWNLYRYSVPAKKRIQEITD